MAETLDFVAYHEQEIPALFAAGHGRLANEACGKGSLAFRVGDAAYTYARGRDAIEITPGDERAEVVIELTPEQWSGVVCETLTAPGLLYSGQAKCRKGNAIGFVSFEPVLRALYNGRPLWKESDPLLDSSGREIDPTRSFERSSDREEMAEFLRSAGYLVVRNVFEPAEIAGFLEEAEALQAEARKGDGLSWWGKNDRGEEILNRITRAGARPRLATLAREPRLLSLVELADDDLQPRSRGTDEQSVTLIFKRPTMKEGLSDLPWHRDCGMGGHASVCPVLIASTFLTEATPESGNLRVLPGSWKGSAPYIDATSPRAPQGVHIHARPGDVSLHYGDTMHAAPPPEDPSRGEFRISATVGFARPDREQPKQKEGYNHVLHGREDGQIEHLSKVTERMSPAGDSRKR